MKDYYLYVPGEDAQQTYLPLSVYRWGITTPSVTTDMATKLTKEDAETLAAILNKYGCSAKVKRFNFQDQQP